MVSVYCICNLRNFQFDHFPKSKIDSKSRFKMSFGQYEMDDRPSVTEINRGGVNEMDRQTNRKKKREMALILIKFKRFFYRY